MKDLLRYANFAKVGAELGVTRQTVARWARGESVPTWAVKQVERLILGQTKEEAAPAWWAGAAESLVLQIEERMMPKGGLAVPDVGAADSPYWLANDDDRREEVDRARR